MRLLRGAPLVVALVLAAGLAAAGNPKTPLGKWMQPNVGTPFASEDYPTVQQNLTIVANKPPPTGDYSQWTTLAKAGADAAGKQDHDGTKASCNQCHKLYKDQYIKDFPNRAFP
jgi:hypothetical protein